MAARSTFTINGRYDTVVRAAVTGKTVKMLVSDSSFAA
jgi:hypothetical protein